MPVASETYAITGREIDDVLGPIPREVFLKEYWRRKSIYIPGTPDKIRRMFGGTFGLDAFRSGLKNEMREVPIQGGPGQDAFYEDRDLDFVDMKAAHATMHEGGTLLTEGTTNVAVSRFCAALKAQLSFAGDVVVTQSYSGQNSGVPLHFDRSCVIAVQCEGSKRWRYADGPVMSWPSGTVAIREGGEPHYLDHDPYQWGELDGVETGRLQEVVLTPGDVLILPAGTPHATSATTEYSISLSILFVPATFPDLLLSVLREKLLDRPENRAIPGDGETQRYMEERLAELRDAVATLRPVDFERARCQAVAQPGGVTLPAMALEAHDDEIGEFTRLRLSTQAPVVAAREQEALTLFYADKQVPIPGAWRGMFERALAMETFTAHSLAEIEPLEEVVSALGTLYRTGILERAL